MKRRTVYGAVGRPIRVGTRGSKYMTIAAGTASSASRWPGDGAGSVAVTEGASGLATKPLSCIDVVLIPAAPAANGQVEIRDASGAATARMVVRALAAGNYPMVSELASGFGLIQAGNCSVAWVGDAAGVSPRIDVLYRDLTGIPRT